MRLILPLSITLPRKTKDDRKINLNLNIYRNLHHMTNNQAKTMFKYLLSQANGLPCLSKHPYRFIYTLFQQSARATDVANVLSIVDKFTCDALVELGVLIDDNHKIIPEVVYRYGGVDKVNPRAELLIKSIVEVQK